MAPGILKKCLTTVPILGRIAKGQANHKAKDLRRTNREADMNEVVMLRGAEPRRILLTVIEKKVPAIMSYLSRDKWYVAKVLLTDIGACRVNVKLSPTRKPHPINIRVDQPVGVSLKYGYGKFVFGTKVVGLEPSGDGTSGGTIVLALPDRIELVQRRSYFRVDVPKSLKVNTLLWHRGQKEADPKHNKGRPETDGDDQVPASHYWQGKLIDISAGGTQVAIDAVQREEFKTGQFIGLRFTPMPYETPLMFNARIRNILPTADGESVCLGVQIVGLEASFEGRQILQRLCNVVERYYQINQSSIKQQDFQRTPSTI